MKSLLTKAQSKKIWLLTTALIWETAMHYAGSNPSEQRREKDIINSKFEHLDEQVL